MWFLKQIFLASPRPLRIGCRVILLSFLPLAADHISDNLFSPFSPGVILNAKNTNPSFLGIGIPPTKGFQTFLPLSMSVNISNNKLVLPSLESLFFIGDNPGNWLAHLLMESFNLSRLNPRQVSAKLTEKLHDGINIHTTMSLHLLDAVYSAQIASIPCGWGFSANTSVNGSVHLPGDLFSLVFSPTSGLQIGNTLAFSQLKSYIEIVTDIKAAYGWQGRKQVSFLSLPSIDMAWGAILLYRLGHALFQLETETGEIVYSNENILSINGQSKIITTGIGLHGNFQFRNPFARGIPVNGYGLGLSGALSLYTKNAALSFCILDLGPMIWKTDLQEANIIIKADSLFLFDLLQNNINNPISGGEFQEKKRLVHMLNTTCCLEYSYRWNLRNTFDPALKNVSAYRILSAGYRQPLFARINLRKYPSFIFTMENGFFDGYLPCKIGWVLSNKERMSSYFEISQVSDGLTFSLWYRAISHLMFKGSTGMEIGIKSRFFWGL